MKPNARQYAAGLWAACQTKPEKDWPAVFSSLAVLLRLRGQSSLAPRVVQHFLTTRDQAAGRVKARVRIARPLSEEASQLIQTWARQRLGATELEAALQPDLLGGVIVECGDRRLDASLAGSLARLRQVLSE